MEKYKSDSEVKRFRSEHSEKIRFHYLFNLQSEESFIGKIRTRKRRFQNNTTYAKIHIEHITTKQYSVPICHE